MGGPGERIFFIEAEHVPDVLRDSNRLALARRIATRYYIGFGTAVAHYGLTTQHTDRSDLVGGVHRATVTSW